MDELRLREIEAEERVRLQIRERLEAEQRVPPASPPIVLSPVALASFPSPAFDPRLYPPPPAAARTNGLSIAALVLGILWLWGLGSVLAVVLGYMAKGQIDSSDGRQAGRGLAIAGIVLGWIGVTSMLVLVLAFAAT
jgi:hypothetical protein